MLVAAQGKQDEFFAFLCTANSKEFSVGWQKWQFGKFISREVPELAVAVNKAKAEDVLFSLESRK